MANADLLQKGFLFEHLSQEELEEISTYIVENDVIAGDYVFDEGSEATSMYVIKSGSVEIRKRATYGDEQHVTDLTAGAHFGEMAFLDRARRAASVLARENVKLLEIKYDDLEKIMKKLPKIGLKLYKTFAQTLCRRIRNTTSDLSSLKELKLKHI